jgi:hypothetical protein
MFSTSVRIVRTSPTVGSGSLRSVVIVMPGGPEYGVRIAPGGQGVPGSELHVAPVGVEDATADVDSDGDVVLEGEVVSMEGIVDV